MGWLLLCCSSSRERRSNAATLFHNFLGRGSGGSRKVAGKLSSLFGRSSTSFYEQLYALEDKVLACDKHAFRIPLAIHREQEPWKLRRWISRWRDVLKESAKASEEQAAPSSRKICACMLGSAGIPCQRPPATRCERKPRRQQHQSHRTVPITEKFRRASKRKPASAAPAAVATSGAAQQPLEAFFLPPGRIPPGPS